jgi:tetratricopeptide (TPR) repeat protein
LIPGRPEAQSALATYEGLVRRDPQRSRIAAEAGLATAPDNVPLLSTAASMERSAGLWEAALAHAQRAELLDPRASHTSVDVGVTLLYLRHYREATPEFERAMTLDARSAGFVEYRALASLGQGDTLGARAVIQRALGHVDTTALAAFFASENSLYWVLDDSLQRRVLTLGPASFDGDRAIWGTVRAEIYWMRGDTARARAYADSASRVFVTQLRGAPQDDLLHLMHGLMLAFLGQKAKAIQEGERGVAIVPVRIDAVTGLYDEQLLAQIYTILGEPDKAVDHLQVLLQVPSFLSPARLRIDPTWAALRGNARFQALTAARG